MKNGDPATKVDLLILGDGYTDGERAKFEKDARRMVDLLFATSPFKERRQDFNVWGLCPPAAESGISRPSTGRHRRSPVGATYDAFGSERYVLTFENRAFRDIASFAPYDVVEIIVNDRTYGGGGIFNLYATVAVDNQWAPYVFVHEFGHHFAGLADEYYTSDVAYLPGEERVEPWEANATALAGSGDVEVEGSGRARHAAADAVAEGGLRGAVARLPAAGAARSVPPTGPKRRWRRCSPSSRRRIRRSSRRARTRTTSGAFEGALYEARGYYRPEADCIMFTRDNVPFCRVCQRAIARVIDLYTR